MSTVEGGMICTNNKKFMNLLMLRSWNGRRLKQFEKKCGKVSELSPKFIFLYPA